MISAYLQVKKSTPLLDVKECFSSQRNGDVIADKSINCFDFLFL